MIFSFEVTTFLISFSLQMLLTLCFNEMMKPLVVILLLLVLAYLQMGFYLHSLKLREEARFEFREKVKTSSTNAALDIFEWDAIKNSVRWEEKDEEFWLKGQLYDVVTQKTIGGKKYIYCLNDTKEEKIIEQQLKLSSSANSGAKDHKTTKFSLPDVLLAPVGEQCSSVSDPSKWRSQKTKEILQYREPAIPPPQA